MNIVVYSLSYKIGDAVDYIPEQVVADIDWTDRNPIKKIYTDFIANNNEMLYSENPKGNCFYQIYEPSRTDTYLQIIRDVTKSH